MTSVPSKKKIESFQDLVVWQKSMDLVAECYQLAHRLPQNEQYGWLLRCGAQPFQFLPISLRVLAGGTPRNLSVSYMSRTALSRS
jgi:23S rRNA-intervening sequence protein